MIGLKNLIGVLSVLTLFVPLPAQAQEVPPAPVHAAPIGVEVEPAMVEPRRNLDPVKFDYTFLPGGDEAGFGVQDLELFATFVLPTGSEIAPLQLTPGAAVHLWHGPGSRAGAASPDLPARVCDLSIDFGWKPQLAPWFFTDLGVTPGLYTDFAEVNDSSFRLRGRALGVVAFSPRCQLVAGVLYVNRNNVKVLPAGGVIWNPTPDSRCQFLFPQPKLAHRITTIGGTAWWAYLAGEFGGGSWSVERRDGLGDSVDYSDGRAIAGLEWDTARGLKGHVELGYVFSRTIDFVSATPDFQPEGTVLVRAGLRY